MHRRLHAMVLLALVGTSSLALRDLRGRDAQAGRRWYTGNTHTHTLNSDGDSHPDDVAQWYKERGYAFLVLTDHNVRTSVEALDALHGLDERFLVIRGEEVTDRFGENPIHVNALDPSRAIAPQGGTSVLDLTAGLISGYGGRLVTTGTPTVRFLTSTVQPRVTLSAGTVLPDPFVVPASDSLRLLASSFAPPSLTNNGVLVLEGTSTITTALTTGSGSTLRVRGSSVGGSPVATFTSAITNSATLDLTAESAGYTTTLVAPSVTNTASGVINSLPGSGGTRILTARLDNAGVVNVPYDLTINAGSAAHVNSGSILLTTGDLAVTQTGTSPSFTNTGTIAASTRTVTVAEGLLDLQTGLITGYGGRLVTTGTPTVRFITTTVQPRVTFSAGTILPDPFTIPANDSLRVLASSFSPPSLTNNGLFVIEGSSTVTTALTTGTGSTLRVRGSSVGGNPVATFTNAITNSATLDLTAEVAGYSVTLVAPSLTNTPSGVVNSLTGSGGTRTLTTALFNAGTVNLPSDLTLNGANAVHGNSGSILLTTGDLQVTQSGATPSFTNTGTIAVNGRTVTVTNASLDLNGGLLSGYSGRLITTGAPTVRFLTATVQDGGYSATLNLGTNTLTNAAGGVFELLPGVVGGSRAVTAAMIENLGTLASTYSTNLNSPVNQRGVMTVGAGTTLTIGGLLQLFTGSTTTVTGTLVMTGTCANLGGTIGGPGVGAACP